MARGRSGWWGSPTVASVAEVHGRVADRDGVRVGRRRGAVVVAACALVALAAGCGGGGDAVTKESFIDGFVTKSGLSRTQAACATDRLFEDLTSDELRRVQTADDWDALSEKERRAITSASATCVTDSVPASDTGTTSTTTGADDSSSTTATDATP